MNTNHFIFPKMSAFLKSFIILLGLVILLTSCATVQVSQDYDTNYVFGNAKTFGWNEKLQQENNRLLGHNDLLAKRFRTAIDKVLTERGFSQDPHPAYLVSYTYTVISRFEVDPGYSNFGFGYGFSRYGYYHGAGFDMDGTVRQYDQGKLVIDIHSPQTGSLLWRGTGTREVYTHTSPDEITRNVSEMVEAILAQFPPHA